MPYEGSPILNNKPSFYTDKYKFFISGRGGGSGRRGDCGRRRDARRAQSPSIACGQAPGRMCRHRGMKPRFPSDISYRHTATPHCRSELRQSRTPLRRHRPSAMLRQTNAPLPHGRPKTPDCASPLNAPFGNES